MGSRRTRDTSPSRRRGRPLVLIAGPDLSGKLAEWLREEGERRGWRLLDFMVTEGSLAGEPTADGALVTGLPDDPLVSRLGKLGCPMVRLGRFEHPSDDAVAVVLPDLVDAGRRAADYFALRGYRNLAVVGIEGMLAAARVRQGMTERAAVLGCTCHEHLFANTQSVAGAAEWSPNAERYEQRTAALIHWLSALPKPVGLVAANALIAARAGVMCQQAGVAVPEEVALLSVENSRPLCEMSPVPISAVDLNPADQVRAAMDVLAEMMARRDVPPRTFVAPRGIVTRRSTDILAVADRRVARAVRFLWDHLDVDLSVEDVVAATRTPRHTLHRLFRKHLKRGINEELRRARLERFRELLRTTDQTVEQLAPQVGFKTATYLTLAFRQTYGLTPRHYRLQAARAEREERGAMDEPLVPDEAARDGEPGT